MKSLLVVNDLSCIGKVAISNIVPVSNCLGVSSSCLPTVLLSSHTGFKNFFKKNLTEEMIQILNHIKDLNLHFNSIMTGYFYDEKQIELFLNNLPSSDFIVVDPIMADNGKLYRGFSDEFPTMMKKLCAIADLIIPNLSEACLLTNTTYKQYFTSSELMQLVDKLLKIGCKNVVITSISTKENMIGVVYCFKGQYGFYETNHIDTYIAGSGDLFAGVLNALILNDIEFEKAVVFAVDFVAKCIQDSKNTTLQYGIEFETHLHLLTTFISKGDYYE